MTVQLSDVVGVLVMVMLGTIGWLIRAKLLDISTDAKETKGDVKELRREMAATHSDHGERISRLESSVDDLKAKTPAPFRKVRKQ